MIPLKYNVRNLRVRWVTTLLTVLATALIVFASCILFGMVEGLQYSLNISGDPMDLIVLRKGSTDESSGGYNLDVAQNLISLNGVKRDEAGRPLVSLEQLNIPIAERASGGRANLIVRGVDASLDPKLLPVGCLLRPDFKVVEGRMFEPGKAECVVSKSLSGRFKGTKLGEELVVGKKESYRVVGLFTAGGSGTESEIWVDRSDLERFTNRTGSVSCVQIRGDSADGLASLRKVITEDQRFKLNPIPEAEYYASQQLTSNFLKVFGAVIAVLLTIGAMFSAANTMFAAVASRMREIGTMRALGFSRWNVLVSFLFESVLLCTLGGVLGLLATIPLSRMTFSTIDNFSERLMNFRFGPLVMIVAFTMTLAMGVFGGLFPALRAVKLNVINALREL